MGRGKIIVEFFSADIVFSVWTEGEQEDWISFSAPHTEHSDELLRAESSHLKISKLESGWRVANNLRSLS